MHVIHVSHNDVIVNVTRNLIGLTSFPSQLKFPVILFQPSINSSKYGWNDSWPLFDPMSRALANMSIRLPGKVSGCDVDCVNWKVADMAECFGTGSWYCLYFFCRLMFIKKKNTYSVQQQRYFYIMLNNRQSIQKWRTFSHLCVDHLHSAIFWILSLKKFACTDIICMRRNLHPNF